MNDFLIPVYLNQRIVFDLLAMAQGGISTVIRVSESEAAGSTVERRASAKFGLSEAFSSLFKIGVDVEASKGQDAQSRLERTQEMVHTPASLFHALRRRLMEKEVLQRADSSYTPKPGDLVEFSATLSRNPLIYLLDTMGSLYGLSTSFIPEAQQGKKSRGGQRSGGVSSSPTVPFDGRRFQQQIDSLLEALRAGGTIDIVASALPSGHRPVITLEQDCLSDPSMADLTDGTFRVLGKVIRVDASSGVNLLRKTPLAAVSRELLANVIDRLEEARDVGSLELPDIVVDIEPPVIQVLPVAIFA